MLAKLQEKTPILHIYSFFFNEKIYLRFYKIQDISVHRLINVQILPTFFDFSMTLLLL